MTSAEILIIFGSLLAVTAIWHLPLRHGPNAIAAMTLAVVTLLSPVTALWLGLTTLATPILMRIGDNTGRRDLVLAIWGSVLVALLFVIRDLHVLAAIGAAYFTLRHLHVLIDWWMGILARPSLGDYARYQLFLPVLAAGPIHRFQNFQRQISRRRKDRVALFEGAERTLFGAFQVVVLGGWAMAKLKWTISSAIGISGSFLDDWILSGLYWIDLYITFSGLTSIALGLSLMLDMRLEENFNRPWAAPNLVDFWTRWHITLSNWCRDYVFRPITAITRWPVAGVFAAMIAMGLWHGLSVYWVGWGLWQGLGIALTRVFWHVDLSLIPRPLQAVLGPVTVFAWLSLANPLLTRLIEVCSP